MKDAGENETIRDKDGNTGHNYIDACNEENYQLTEVGTCAGEGAERGRHRNNGQWCLHHRRSVSACI